MVAKKRVKRTVKTSKKVPKDANWEEIGKAIGTKMEKSDWNSTQCKPWMYYSTCGSGGLGRFLFIIGVLSALNVLGHLAGIPLWILALIVIGFSAMKL